MRIWTRFVAFKMARLGVLVSLGLFTLNLQGQTNQMGAAHENRQDQTTTFLKQAARHHDMATAMAEVGARKAQNQQLKQYCLQLQQEQIQVSNQLKPLAQQHGVSIDQVLTKQDQKELSKLDSSKGTKFDRQLATDLLKEEHHMVGQLQQASTQSSASDVKQFAAETLPKAQQHFQQIQTLAKDVGVKQSTISALSGHTPAAVGGAE